MRPSTWHTLHDGLHAVTVVVAFLGAFSTDLQLGALIGFVAHYFLAVEALIWALSAFEWLGVAQFPSCIEEAFLEEVSHIQGLVEVDDHGAVCLCHLFVAEPGYFCDLGVIFSPKGFCHSGADIACLIKHCCTVDAVHSDRVDVG